MTKKGAALWISVVLYFGIGIVILTILLTAGLPVINKLRDKNIVIQTKEVMHTLDENTRDVIKEGPGSQRVVTVNIKKGSLVINEDEDSVTWVYENSRTPISEPGIDVPEGKLFVKTELGRQDGTYDIKIKLSYSEIPADVTKEGSTGNIIGLTNLVIRNNGLVENPNNPGEQIVQVVISEA